MKTVKLPKNFGKMKTPAYRLATDTEIETKKTLATLRKIIRKEYGAKCKERSPLCCVCVAYQCVEDLQELLTI